MPFSGRLADRIGGGPVAAFGVVLMTAATIPLAFVGAHTPYAVTSIVLFFRGIGQGFSVMPAMAAAYQTLSRVAVPRATTALNALQRIGASIGTAVLAVVLESQIAAHAPNALGAGGGSVAPLPEAMRQRIATPLADAFAHTFWWAAAFTAIAVVPAIVLVAKAPRRSSSTSARDEGESAPRSSLHVAALRLHGS
jgi:predicted MFS family arabinose efflux permease